MGSSWDMAHPLCISHGNSSGLWQLSRNVDYPLSLSLTHTHSFSLPLSTLAALLGGCSVPLRIIHHFPCRRKVDVEVEVVAAARWAAARCDESERARTEAADPFPHQAGS